MDSLTLLRFITGECTPAEEREVQAWSLRSTEHARSLQQLQEIWDAGSLTPDEIQFQVDEDWKRLESRIERATAPVIIESRAKAHRDYKPGGSGQTVALWMKIAASILVTAMAGVWIWQMSFVPEEESVVVMRDIIMERGQQSNMLLSDGSHITINADSHIRLPQQFESDRRDLYLESGEIFVDIESDPARPFFIHTNGSVIEVLGTAFSVRSYPEDQEVRVVVQEGVVSLASTSNGNRHISLTENQVGRYHISDNQLSSDLIQDPELFFGWIDGYLKFDEAPLARVVRDLERRYNVEILLEQESMGAKRLTAELKGRTIQNVMSVLSAALDLRIEQLNEDKILFKERTI